MYEEISIEVLLLLCISLNSRSISYKKYSDCSSIMIFLGFNLIICLHNSDPIDPPAPVMNTDLFSMQAVRRYSLGLTASLPSKSSIFIFSICEILIVPDANSLILGSFLIIL